MTPSPAEPNAARHVYLLFHSYEIDDCDEVKLIGVYDSRDMAEAAVERLRGQPGFADHPEGFHIDRYSINKNFWADGFK